VISAGDRVGEYTIVEPISVGKSGQADVYLARRSDDTGSPFAIKILAEHLKSDSRSVKDFEEEAELLTKLAHRNIVRIEAFDTSPPTPYIVQEYIQGRTVAEVLAQTVGPLPLDSVLRIALQVADALSYAHGLEYFKIKQTKDGGKSSRKQRGIIHRDLSSDNILITESGDVRLIDFGIARAVGVATITTATGIGKEYYVAPEVEVGGETAFSPAVDIYSFGVCLYEMVMTGRPEKRRISVLRQFHKNLHHLYAAFPDDVPEKLRQVIVHCVQREPKARPPIMEEVKDCLLSIPEELAGGGTPATEVPHGLSIQSGLFRLDRLLALPKENAGDMSMRFALDAEETRLLVLCDGQTKVYSFNLSGGEKQVYHVPRGQRLSALAPIDGHQALGVLTQREGLLLLDESGEWNAIKSSACAGEPRTIPDSLVVLGESVYLGDYATGRIVRLHAEDASLGSSTPEGSVAQLGPFTICEESLFSIDMTRNVLLKADLALEKFEVVASLPGCGWPISIAARENLLFIVDAQNRCLYLVSDAGHNLDVSPITWEKELTISQVVFSESLSRLIVLEVSLPALMFFEVKPIDSEVLQLSGALRGLGMQAPELSYQEIETSVLSSIRQSRTKEALGFRVVDRLKRLETSRIAVALQAAVYSELAATAQQDGNKGLLRRLACLVDDLGNSEKAKQLYSAYLSQVDGYDPVIRDKYGKLLEREQLWEEIRDLEGKFLTRPYFRDIPANRGPFESSYQRLRRAYAALGVPVPKEFRIPPTSQLYRAIQLLGAREYEEARKLFAQMIDSEDYRQMRPADAILMLAGHADSIKRRLGVLTVQDWQEVHSSLSILVRDYSDSEGFNSEYRRDLEAARRQVEKLKGASTPS
jgi:serine/threonine protein kinase